MSNFKFNMYNIFEKNNTIQTILGFEKKNSTENINKFIESFLSLNKFDNYLKLRENVNSNAYIMYIIQKKDEHFFINFINQKKPFILFIFIPTKKNKDYLNKLKEIKEKFLIRLEVIYSEKCICFNTSKYSKLEFEDILNEGALKNNTVIKLNKKIKSIREALTKNKAYK